MRPLSTGLSRVVVERAQAEPPPPLKGLCWRLHRLRSLEEEEAPSSLEVEPDDTRRCSFGDPYLGEQHGLSMRLWTLSSDVDICRVRADTSEDVVVDEGRGDQALECSPAPLLLGRLSV